MINNEETILKNGIEINNKMSKSLPCSPWIDYTKAHENIRNELENTITNYVIKQVKGIRTPVIVAPYGSGKTTLLRHLLCYSIGQGIPAIKINLLDFVSFLESQNISDINEDNLIGYISLFCTKAIEQTINCLQSSGQNCLSYVRSIIDEFSTININKDIAIEVLSKFLKTKDQRCVLLIDEIEEGYEHLRKIVRFGTTPFRGIFDLVYQGLPRIFPILAFGPSSIYSEIVSNAGSWRVVSYVIPMIMPTNITQRVTNLSPYISNLIWWIGKGRPGHVDKLLQMKIHVEAQNALTNCQGILETDAVKNLQGTYVVGNIPYIDQAAYRRIETSLNNDERNLFRILSVLVGPVPESMLSKCIDMNKIKYSKLPEYFIKSTQLIKVDDALNILKKVLLNLGYTINDFARDILYALFYSWSDHDMMILDKRGLTELIGIAKDMAIEFYQNDLFNALSKLDLDALYTELLNSKRDSNEHYYALAPLTTLGAIYPPVLLMPLIGCCKEKSLDDLYRIFDKFTIKDLLNLSDRLQEEIINYAHMRGMDNETIQNMNKYKVVFVLSKYIKNDEFIKQIKKLLTNDYIHGIVFIPLPYNEDPSSIVSSLRELWQDYIDVGLIDIMYPSARAILFLMGLIYNKYVRCDVKYTDRELGMYDQFMRAIIELLKEIIINRLPSKRNKIAQAIVSSRTTEAIKEELENILSEGYNKVGSGKERYLLLLAGAEHRNILEQYLNTLIAKKSGKYASSTGIIEDVVKRFKELINTLHDHGIEIKHEVTSGFESFLDNAWDYYDDIRSRWDQIYDQIQSGDVFNKVLEVLNDLYTISNLPKEAETRQLIEEEFNKITKKVIGNNENNIKSLITWIVLQKMLNKHPDKLPFNDEEECKDSTEELSSSLSKLGDLDNIVSDIDKILNKIGKYIDNKSVGILNELEKIKEIINNTKDSINEVSHYIEDCTNRLVALNTVEKMWFLEFIMRGWSSGRKRNKGLMANLLDNISSIIDDINSSLLNNLKTVLRNLNDIEADLEELKKLTASDNELSLGSVFAIADYGALIERYRKDLEQVLLNSGTIPELAQKLSILKDAVNDLANTIKTIRRDNEVLALIKKIEYNINRLSKEIQEIEGGEIS
ncbi:hypothetical protein [Vulcanisaeta distributa]|uniref:Uncharacterized protein n=1 Tax=Vulcanisaeta distributa (strain DSM 14429 / JCM 11212 / NBRC 100878 / IC-017) TaxID=572478 RepID=E1QSS2_VULDI|nr:hypothetical protein [Vulcanisaeta distributa]ADN49589.1 hypothetical protein Vdis_0176 [Vulcanisaeta distributa DSM 14429]